MGTATAATSPTALKATPEILKGSAELSGS